MLQKNTVFIVAHYLQKHLEDVDFLLHI